MKESPFMLISKLDLVIGSGNHKSGALELDYHWQPMTTKTKKKKNIYKKIILRTKSFNKASESQIKTRTKQKAKS